MDAVTPIEKFNAAKRVQRKLKKDPNDIEALLQLADMLGTLKKPDLEQKRKILQRVLSLEPTHSQARQMLFEMDRAAIGGDSSRLSAAVMLTDPPTKTIAEKPLRLRYSLIHQFLVYLLVAFTIFLVLSNLREPEALAVFVAFLVFLLIPIWFVSVVIEISDTELSIYRLFGVSRTEISWNDIKEYKSIALGQGVRVITNDGRVVELSAQIMGYSSLIEILRQMRPDLFGIMSGSTPGMTQQDGSAVSAARAKIFQKGFLAKYAPLLGLALVFLIFVGSVITLQCLVAVPGGLILFLVWRIALHTPYLLKLEDNRLLAQSFRKKIELSPQQIKSIEIGTTYRYKYAWAQRHIQVELQDGSSFRLAGFIEGDEILYGFLKNWWSTHQTP